MKDSPKFRGSTPRRLLVIVIFTLLAVMALASVAPGILIGPLGGSVASY